MPLLTRTSHDATGAEAYVIACLIHGDWERALELIDELGPAPEYAPHLSTVAAHLLAEGKTAPAIRVASRAVEQAAACAAAYSVLGRALLVEESTAINGSAVVPAGECRAESALRRAIELSPQDLAARVALADVCYQQRRFEAASCLLRQALVLDPRDATAREALKRLRKSVEAAIKEGSAGDGSLDDPGTDSGSRSERQRLPALLGELRKLSAQLHQPRAAAGAPTLSLCLITRDEARNLPRVIESVRGLATEVIVVDTGSTDNTVRVAQRLKARVEQVAWDDDFAAARNHSLNLATGEWILVLDADDEFSRESVPFLRQWLSSAPEAEVVGLYRRYPSPGMQRDSVSVQPRLFRNGRGLRFKGAIHEQLVTADSQVAQPDITLTATIYHYGAIDGPGATARRWERNSRILLRALEREPDDWRNRFYLGLTQFEAERWNEAIPLLQAVVVGAGDEVDFLPKAYACLGNALLNAHRPLQAEETLRAGLERFPHHPELWFCLGLVCDHLGRLEEAITANEAALRGRFGPSLNWHDWACREAKPHLGLCDLKLTLGDPTAAAKHLAAAEQFTGPEPAYAQIREAIVRTEAELERHGAEQERLLIEQRAKFAAGDAEAGCRVIDLLLARGQQDEARAFLDAWPARMPADGWSLIASGRVHLAFGAVEAALRCFSAARQAQPELIAAWLGEAAAQSALNQWDEAESALLNAARLEPESVEVDLALGEHYLERERWEEATRAFQRCLGRQEDQGSAWLGLGKSLLRSGNLPAAINCYQRAASLISGGTAVRLALGEARDLLARRPAAARER